MNFCIACKKQIQPILKDDLLEIEQPSSNFCSKKCEQLNKLMIEEDVLRAQLNISTENVTNAWSKLQEVQANIKSLVES